MYSSKEMAKAGLLASGVIDDLEFSFLAHSVRGGWVSTARHKTPQRKRLVFVKFF